MTPAVVLSLCLGLVAEPEVIPDPPPCPQLPPAAECWRLAEQADRDWHVFNGALDLVGGWPARDLRVGRSYSYRVWRVWNAAARTQSNPTWWEPYATDLVDLVGEDAFNAGRLPMPLGVAK